MGRTSRAKNSPQKHKPRRAASWKQQVKFGRRDNTRGLDMRLRCKGCSDCAPKSYVPNTQPTKAERLAEKYLDIESFPGLRPA